MAEMPHPWTPLLVERRYLDFAAAVVARGLAGGPGAPTGAPTNAPVNAIAAAARREHAALDGVRLPPGPTAEYVVIERLVAAGLIAPAALALTTLDAGPPSTSS